VLGVAAHEVAREEDEEHREAEVVRRAVVAHVVDLAVVVVGASNQEVVRVVDLVARRVVHQEVEVASVAADRAPNSGCRIEELGETAIWRLMGLELIHRYGSMYDVVHDPQQESMQLKSNIIFAFVTPRLCPSLGTRKTQYLIVLDSVASSRKWFSYSSNVA
jgi:hypothetical protein